MQKGTLESSINLTELTFSKIGKRTAKECLTLLNKVVVVFLRSVELLINAEADIIVADVQKVRSLMNIWMKNSLSCPFGASTLVRYWSKEDAELEIMVNFDLKFNDELTFEALIVGME